MSFKLIETQYEPEVVGRAVKTMISKLNYTRFYTRRQAHSVLHWEASTLGSSLGGKLHLVPYWGNARGNCGQEGVWISWINVGCSSLWVNQNIFSLRNDLFV